MARSISALRLGARVCFEDRWQGTISAIDIAEDWEVLNVTVSSGMLFFANSVKLPFSSAERWTDDSVYLGMSSFAAFAREVPPIAAPSRPVSRETPVATQGSRIAGLMVGANRRATEVLIARGMSGLFRIPVTETVFDGKTVSLGRQSDNIPAYAPDAELLQRVRDAIAADPDLVSDHKLGLTTAVENGLTILIGNVRVERVREHLEAIARSVPGVTQVRNEIVDDITLETNIGQALNRSGVSRYAEVFARSNVGVVTVYGQTMTPHLVDDVMRAVARVPGVREVKNLMELRPAVVLPPPTVGA